MAAKTRFPCMQSIDGLPPGPGCARTPRRPDRPSRPTARSCRGLARSPSLHAWPGCASAGAVLLEQADRALERQERLGRRPAGQRLPMRLPPSRAPRPASPPRGRTRSARFPCQRPVSSHPSAARASVSRVAIHIGGELREVLPRNARLSSQSFNRSRAGVAQAVASGRRLRRPERLEAGLADPPRPAPWRRPRRRGRPRAPPAGHRHLEVADADGPVEPGAVAALLNPRPQRAPVTGD